QMADLMAGRPERREVQPLVVREYAHKPQTRANAEERSDDAETLVWYPVIVLPDDGRTDVSFGLSDSVTRFQATAFAHTLDGRLGSATLVFDSKLPFTLYPRTPIEVTAGDRIELPVGIGNNTGGSRTVDLALKDLKGLELVEGKDHDQFTV